MPVPPRHLLTAALLLAATAHAAPPETPSGACVDIASQAEVTLAALVDRALCANVDTRAAWQRTRTQTAQVGIARSAYYPTLDASASQSRSLVEQPAGGDPDQTSLSLSSNWLLWDFGGRRASLEQTQQTLAALQATYDARSQQVALSAVQAWFTRLAAGATLEAARATLLAADETARAARQRVLVGVGTREDELQADTALAQAQLGLIQRQGELASADGQLAVVASYPANQPLKLADRLPTPDSSTPAPALDELMAQAQRLRPDRAAQQRSIAAAESDLDRIAAQALPRIGVSASAGDSRDSNGRSDTGQIALTASLPLFTGFQQRNQETAAQSQIELQRIELQRIEQQVSLDVWLAWQAYTTAQARIGATDSLLAAASESTRAALARYRAGLGNLLNVLNAQSSLADARQQQARARYDWASARLQLARASGVLVRDPDALLMPTNTQEPRP